MDEDQGSNPDFAEHERTYRMFLRLVIGAAISGLITLALLALFLL